MRGPSPEGGVSFLNIITPDHPVNPDLSPRLLALLRRHRDLCRERLAITRQIADVERQIQIAETNTRRAVSGTALTVFALN